MLQTVDQLVLSVKCRLFDFIGSSFYSRSCHVQQIVQILTDSASSSKVPLVILPPDIAKRPAFFITIAIMIKARIKPKH